MCVHELSRSCEVLVLLLTLPRILGLLHLILSSGPQLYISLQSSQWLKSAGAPDLCKALKLPCPQHHFACSTDAQSLFTHWFKSSICTHSKDSENRVSVPSLLLLFIIFFLLPLTAKGNLHKFLVTHFRYFSSCMEQLAPTCILVAKWLYTRSLSLKEFFRTHHVFLVAKTR